MPKLTKLLWVLLLALPMVLITSTSVLGEKPPEYFVDEGKLPFDALPGATAYWGIHNNAGYRIEVPANWNGDLVMFAHGLRFGLELTVDNAPIREWLISQGYAWAASSYSRTDYDVATGAQDTHALTKRFNGLVGLPDRIYLMGISMGGHITAAMIEQWPNTYDGAMPLCGVIGDYELINYFADFNLVAQALTGIDTGYPLPQDYLTTYANLIIEGLELFPGGWPFFLNPAGENLKAFNKMQSGGERPTFNESFMVWNSVFGGIWNFAWALGDGNWARTQGIAYDNMDRVYQFDADPALTSDELDLNESILRVARDPQGIHPNGLANAPVVHGNIKVPVLSMHTLGDPLVPFSMQQFYAKRVAANGDAEWLVQRAIRDIDHCGFTEDELVSGFSDLVNWVEHGVKPLGDDVLDPDIVADPDYGCAFTSEDRTVPIPLPSCP